MRSRNARRLLQPASSRKRPVIPQLCPAFSDGSFITSVCQNYPILSVAVSSPIHSFTSIRKFRFWHFDDAAPIGADKLSLPIKTACPKYFPPRTYIFVFPARSSAKYSSPQTAAGKKCTKTRQEIGRREKVGLSRRLGKGGGKADCCGTGEKVKGGFFGIRVPLRR